MRSVAFVALLVFVFALPWERNVSIPGVGAAGSLLGMFVMALTAMSLVNHGRIRMRAFSLFLGLMAAFVAWSALSFFWSIAPGASVVRTVSYAQLFLMAWIVWELCRTEAERLALMQSYVLGGYFAMAAMAVDLVLGQAAIVEWSAERYSFAGGDPNYLAAGLALGLPMAWHLYLARRESWFGVLNALYVPLVVIAIGLTGSRGGMLAALVAILIVPVTFWSLAWWRRGLVLVLLSGLLYTGFLVIPEVNLQRFTGLTEDLAEVDLAGREAVWRAAFELLTTDQTLSAVGSGSGTFRPAVEPILGWQNSAHSAYLAIWVTLGGVGLLLFLGMVVVAVVPNLLGRGPPRVFALVQGAALLVAIAPVSWDNQKILWFVLVLLTTFRAIVLPGEESSTADERGRLHNVARSTSASS